MQSTLRKNLLMKTVVGTLLLCGLGLAGYTSFHDRSSHQREFDSNGWKEGNPRTRGQMVASLQAQSLLLKKTRDELLGLLGKPDEEVQGLLRYRVDVGLRIAWEPFLITLAIEFDEKTRVYRAVTVD
jgi:hypothetical protein